MNIHVPIEFYRQKLNNKNAFYPPAFRYTCKLEYIAYTNADRYINQPPHRAFFASPGARRASAESSLFYGSRCRERCRRRPLCRILESFCDCSLEGLACVFCLVGRIVYSYIYIIRGVRCNVRFLPFMFAEDFDWVSRWTWCCWFYFFFPADLLREVFFSGCHWFLPMPQPCNSG